MEKKHGLSFYCTILAVVFVLVGSIFGWILASSDNQVRITQISIPTNNGQWLTANLYKPNTATAKSPAPVVITCHGYTDSKEKQDEAAIELSRRGIVVIEMDAYQHGLSSGTAVNSSPGSTMTEGVGLIDMVKFVASSDMNYVDKTKIGITGHSMGGMAVNVTLEYFGKLENDALKAAALPNSPGGTTVTPEELAQAKSLNLVYAGFLVSALPDKDPAKEAMYHANIGINYTLYDEGAYRNTNKGDVTAAPETLAFINAIMPKDQQINKIDLGIFYENTSEGTVRVVYNPVTTHTFAWMAPETATNMVTFFTNVYHTNTTLAANDQVYFTRKLFTGLTLFGLFMLIPAFVSLILKYDFFTSLKRTVPAAQPALKTSSDKGVFWIGWLVIIAATAFLLIPSWVLTGQLFPAVANMNASTVFPDPNVNAFAIWSVIIGVITFILFWINYKLRLKKRGETMKTLGISVPLKDVFKAIVLAVLVTFLFYAVVYTIDFFTKGDARLWLLAAKTFTPDKVAIALEYIPFFFVFMAAHSIATNCSNRIEGQKEWVNLLINIIGNVVGIVIVVLIQYISIFCTGVGFPPYQPYWDKISLLFPFMVLIGVTTLISRSLFKKTGNVWAGTFVNTFIATMLLVCSTATFLTY